MDKNWNNYGRWRHPEMFKQSEQMNKPDKPLTTLNQIAGAMFLTNSRFTTQAHISSEMLNPECNIDHQERVRYEIIQNLTKHTVDTFSKEIKKRETYDGEVHSLELFIFPTEALKLAVEYIISAMPQSEIDRIRTTPIHVNEQIR